MTKNKVLESIEEMEALFNQWGLVLGKLKQSTQKTFSNPYIDLALAAATGFKVRFGQLVLVRNKSDEPWQRARVSSIDSEGVQTYGKRKWKKAKLDLSYVTPQNWLPHIGNSIPVFLHGKTIVAKVSGVDKVQAGPAKIFYWGNGFNRVVEYFILQD